ncbi:TPA: phosphoethanolamine transferase, partial [Haemophilus influenzae]
DNFESCKISFHNQLSSFIINIMGYNYSVSTCDKGVVNGNILTGDAGYLKIESNGKQEYVH